MAMVTQPSTLRGTVKRMSKVDIRFTVPRRVEGWVGVISWGKLFQRLVHRRRLLVWYLSAGTVQYLYIFQILYRKQVVSFTR